MLKKLLVVTTFLTIGACDSANSTTTTSGNSGLTEAQVREIVGKYIDENPKVIIASLEKYQQQQMAEDQEKAKTAVKDNRDRMLNSKHSAIVGDANSANYMVEFFDYNCGFCKRATPAVNQVLAEQKNIKVVFLELPVLGPSSELAAAAAITVQLKEPGKYLAFHNKLMEHNGPKDLVVINDLAKEVGITDIKFAEEIHSPEVLAAIEENRKLADDLGIRGTPAFVINDELVPGAIPYEEMVKVIKETSKK